MSWHWDHRTAIVGSTRYALRHTNQRQARRRWWRDVAALARLTFRYRVIGRH